ncbi:MAG TPA: 4-(cytidine 5'-diphospho)-2-C-methyl-D-erythritol kinase [Bacteroidales bacterium]|nr:4-(cytidine 5'-diphospho)-2-C-methyl-D-erythritol kinase [Bacteroidales bacterium]HPO64786.1 4-(cytidine 5'-diphospho)-2-C-methyl-D-erythritol kinase [Bacteroidales bacterium]
MIVFPNAKINLGLHVIEKRADGYHNLETVFYPVPLCDVLEIITTEGEGVRFFNYGLPIDAPIQKNSCVRAYTLVAERYQVPALEIHLYKHIPFGAGLGGGSSDATHTLLALNSLLNLNIPFSSLEELALQLGSDCPFFLYNKAMYATGRGEILQPIELSLSGRYLLLVKPSVNVSTADAYQGIIPHKPENSLSELIQLPIQQWKNYIQNDFEQFVFAKYPLLQEVKNKLYEMGALYAAMSGSGSTLFGIFDEAVKIPADFSDFFTWAGWLP